MASTKKSGQSRLLELSLKCSELKFASGQDEALSVILVQYRQPWHGFWTPMTQTEAAQGQQPNFLTTVCFYASPEFQEDTHVRFVVYHVKELASDKLGEIGSGETTFGDLHRSGHLELQLSHKGNPAGTLYLHAIRLNKSSKVKVKSQKSISKKVLVPIDQSLAAGVSDCFNENGDKSSLQNSLCNSVFRSYRFPTDTPDHYISVQESMMECRHSFDLPLAYLKLCIDEETKKISQLEMLSPLTQPWDAIRRRKVDVYKKYLTRYNARMQHLMMLKHPPFFKKSVDKTSADLEFVPTNLHVQRLRVSSGRFVSNDPNQRQDTSSNQASASQNESVPTASVSYDIITAGAATAHSIGYKHGGLLSQLTNMDEGGKSKKSLPLHPIAHCLRTSNKSDQLLITVEQLEHQIFYQIEKLRSLISQLSSKSELDIYSPDKVNASHEALATLSRKTCELVTYLDSENVSSAVISLSEARPASRPLLDTSLDAVDDCTNQIEGSLLVNGTSHTAAFKANASSELNRTPSITQQAAWEDLKLAIKSVLSDVVRSVHGVITPDREEKFLRGSVSTSLQHQTAAEDLDALRDSVTKACEEATSSMTFQDLTRAEIAFQNELTYRRKVVFSQALSALTCGVTTAMTSSLTNEMTMHQFAEVGILYQVESLLSTYGNELGMLQDYAVGVMDLQCVMFKCVQIREGAGAARSDAFLPSLSGATNALTVLLPFERSAFNQLPPKLRAGNLISVHPVIFSVGINEEQTLAEKFGSTSLQEYLNLEAVQRIFAYYDLVRDLCPNCINEQLRNAGSFLRETAKAKPPSPFNSADRKVSVPVINPNPEQQRPIMDLLNVLRESSRLKKNKNVEILQLASDITRRLNGIRVTSCKSAKDRTAMSVTLEQVRILANEHRMSHRMFSQALSCMRSEGTRRENTLKNVGARKYAFTSVQLMTFPKLYRAPEGTYGKADT